MSYRVAAEGPHHISCHCQPQVFFSRSWCTQTIFHHNPCPPHQWKQPLVERNLPIFPTHRRIRCSSPDFVVTPKLPRCMSQMHAKSCKCGIKSLHWGDVYVDMSTITEAPGCVSVDPEIDAPTVSVLFYGWCWKFTQNQIKHCPPSESIQYGCIILCVYKIT